MDIILYLAIGIVLLTILYFIFPTRKIVSQNKVIKQQAEEISFQNRILEEQNEQLRILNLEKSQLISVVSHDLKSPLNRVFALTNLLTMDGKNLTKDQREYIDRIHIVVAEGLNLIRNLLDIRAIEDDGIILKSEEIELDKFLGSQLRTFRQEAFRKNIQLVCHGHTIKMVGDSRYLSRVLDNIVSNAIKYTPPDGQVMIDYREEGDNILFSIEDEGPGILAEEQENLFRKYEVLSSKPTGGESSTGLGLSIAKSLVEKMGGTIWNANKEEGGSVFSFTVPKGPDN